MPKKGKNREMPGKRLTKGDRKGLMQIVPDLRRYCLRL